MTDPVKTTSLAEALVLFQQNLPVLGKDKTAKIPPKKGTVGPGYSYRYADLSSITEVVMPLLAKVGLSFTCKTRRNDDGTYDLVGVLRHSSGQSDEGFLPLFTRGTAQETGSSMTYARRYLLTAMTGVVPDEDDDGAAAARAQNAYQNQSQERPRQQPKADPLNNVRQQTFNRYRAANPNATQDQFIAAVVQEFAQPFDDVTADQLATFGQARS